MCPAVSRTRRRVHLYGCGVVAPGAANVKEFLAEIEAQKCVLVPEPELNNAFLVGKPKFDFRSYESWITSRHNQTKFAQLNDKAGECVRFAIGTAIEALESNPGIEDAIRKSDPRVAIIYGSGFGDLNHMFQGIHEYDEASAEWNFFWTQPERNEAVARYRQSKTLPANFEAVTLPNDPNELAPDSPQRARATKKWNAFWAPHSAQLKQFVSDFAAIEQMTIGGDVANDKLNIIRAKAKARKQLIEKFACPTPPWDAVNPQFLWNLPNANAAQVSMMLGVHGTASASIGACATFGLLMRQGFDAIQSGEYDIAILGTTDVTPPPAVVAAFHSAKVLAAGPDVGIPLSQLRGTHVAGGSCTWIIGAEDVLAKLNVKPLGGVEILGVGLSSDAEHIITPSAEGPKHCIRDAFRQAGISPSEIDTWDMHATGTPGDASEFKLIEDFVPKTAVLTARKGIFGHGMSTCGGWEMTAQVLGAKWERPNKVLIQGSGIPSSTIHASIGALGRNIATDKPISVDIKSSGLTCGKLSMGIGGISSCVITRVHPR